MKNNYTKILKKIRNNQLGLSDFLYSEIKDKNGNIWDSNFEKRFELLKTLLSDRKKSDETIIKELFLAEIKMHENLSMQGIYPSLKIAGYLLSEYKKPEYSLLFLRAKEANYDTVGDFDYEYIVSAGIKETFEFIKKQPSEISDIFYKYMGRPEDTCYLTEEDLDYWKECIEDEYNK